MTKLVTKCLPAIFSIAFPVVVHATGGEWEPERWLENGGKSLSGTPEFFWSVELKRLAQEYAEKNLPPKFKEAPSNDRSIEDRIAATTKADIDDFEDALKTERLKPADVAAARTAHQAVRAWLEKGENGVVLGVTEVDSEFADYHKAAIEFSNGKSDEAQSIWEKLLQRPAAERHYRTVWAAYMLGKCCMKEKETRAKAIAWFEKCRQYALEGYADSLNLAAESFGWQARVELDQGNTPAAARHYLQQLALGDPSAIASIKLLVPDRSFYAENPNLSFATYPPMEPADPYASPGSPADQPEAARKLLEQQLLVAAKDEVLRQITTAHILATSTPSGNYDQGSESMDRATNWLKTIESLKLDHLDGAASLAWVAYNNGKFREAESWLRLDNPATPLGNWLRAKLAMRKGDFSTASSIMAKVVPALGPQTNEPYGEGYQPTSSASADLGASLLAQGKFLEAFDAFWQGDCAADATYLAERVLTTEELLGFVKKHAALNPEDLDRAIEGWPPSEADQEVLRRRELRNLTGKRLVREGNITAGRPLLDATARRAFDDYQAFLAMSDDVKKPKGERAKALFEAAQEMIEHGIRWQGSQNDQGDNRANDGSSGYANGEAEKAEGRDSIIDSRFTGRFRDHDPDADNENKPKSLPLFIPATPAEQKRLRIAATTHVAVGQYRRIAAELATKAAALMPDQAEETADLLNQAGRWIQDLDHRKADKIYFQIEKRCAKTKIGAAVIAKHWFIEPQGPWTAISREEVTPDPVSEETPPLPQRESTD